MVQNGHLWPFRIIFKALWRPPMAIPDPGKGPNSSPRMCPDLIQPRSTQIHQFGAARSTYGHKMTIYGHFGPFWGPMAPPNGHSGPGKGSQHIVPDVPGLDPTLIHADPPVWSCQACLWHNRAIYGIFEPFWDPLAPPMAIPDLGKGPNTSPWMCPNLIQP